MNNKLSTMILKLVAAIAALAACVCAVAYYWDSIVHYIEAGRKLYCHERKLRGHQFRSPERDDYADLDWENTEL
ncbi:MAG: hypothetical protein LUD79_04345 [Oscillospiraceae bacterium]|nr:hypothetical protein [Oscillospiraceae bacterium]